MSSNANKCAIANCVIAVCALSVSLVAQTVTQPVRVVNSTGQPVPTAAQGTTTIAGTVDIGNTPTVTLSSGNSIAVTNLPGSQGNPTPLATLEAVQVYGSHCGLTFDGSDSGACSFIPIPFGKQLVIQEFDAFGRVETGNRPYEIALTPTVSGGDYFPYTFMVNTNGLDFLNTHQQTRLYVSQGTTPHCFVAVPTPSNGLFNCNISGFLVDVSLAEHGTAQDPAALPQLLNKLPVR